MRRPTLLFVALLITGSAHHPASAALPATKPTSLAAKMERKLPGVKFNHDVRLSRVFDSFREVSDVNLLVDWASLEKIGIGKDDTMRLGLENPSVENALTQLLAAVSDPKKPAKYVVDGQVVVITSQEGADRVLASARRFDESVKANPKLKAALEKPLPEVKFDQVGLGDTIDFIKDVTQLPIRVDWDGLKAAGINPNTPVVARLYDIPTGQALRHVLLNASPTGEAEIRIKDDVILIGAVTARK